MTQDISPTEDPRDLKLWLDEGSSIPGDERRQLRTAVSRVLDAALQQSQQTGVALTLSWALEHTELLQELLIDRHGLNPVTASTYVSRFRRAVRAFQSGKGLPTRAASPSAPRRPAEQALPPEEQLAEAFESLKRWPALRHHLAPAIARAAQELFGAKSPHPSPATPEDQMKKS